MTHVNKPLVAELTKELTDELDNNFLASKLLGKEFKRKVSLTVTGAYSAGYADRSADARYKAELSHAKTPGFRMIKNETVLEYEIDPVWDELAFGNRLVPIDFGILCVKLSPEYSIATLRGYGKEITFASELAKKRPDIVAFLRVFEDAGFHSFYLGAAQDV